MHACPVPRKSFIASSLPALVVYEPALTAIDLIHRTQQLRLQYEFPFLVLLRRLKRLVVLPPHRLLALPAHYVPHDVPARRHVAFVGVRLRNVDDGVEEVGFAVLAAEVLEIRSFEQISTVFFLIHPAAGIYCMVGSRDSRYL